MTFIATKIIPNLEDISKTQIKTFKGTFTGSSLIINQILTDEAGNETEVPFMDQSWKCLPDGSREPFINEDDAKEWVELVKDTLF